VGRLQREGERPRRARVAFRRGSAAEETVAGLLCTGGGDGGRRPRLWWRGGAVVGGGAAGLRSLRESFTCMSLKKVISYVYVKKKFPSICMACT
jgi:hypothetical protein